MGFSFLISRSVAISFRAPPVWFVPGGCELRMILKCREMKATATRERHNSRRDVAAAEPVVCFCIRVGETESHRFTTVGFCLPPAHTV